MTTGGTWYNGPTLTLASGTWVIVCQVTVASATNTAQRVSARLSNSSTTYYAEGEMFSAAAGAGNRGTVTIPLIAQTVLGASTTMRLEANSTANSALLKAEITTVSSVADMATKIIAFKIA